MLWTEIILAVLASFIAVRVITRAHIFAGPRSFFRRIAFRMPSPISSRFVMTAKTRIHRKKGGFKLALLEPDADEPANATISGYDFISCPLCVGFYVSGVVTLLYGLPISCWIPVYGAAYLLDNLSE